jgi:hypothetical protein
VNPRVPEAFDPIVLAMLQHDPEDRPQTAAEVQRLIASAIPGAANREASEIGAIAVEVRDKCAERRTRRANTEAPGSDSNRSFSPSPRQRMSSEYRIEVGGPPGSGVHVVPLPVLPPWWRRRGVQIGAGLLGAVVILSILLGHHGTGSDANARAASRPERELVAPHGTVTRVEASPLRPTLPSPPTVVQTSTAVSPPAAPPPPLSLPTMGRGPLAAE